MFCPTTMRGNGGLSLSAVIGILTMVAFTACGECCNSHIASGGERSLSGPRTLSGEADLGLAEPPVDAVVEGTPLLQVPVVPELEEHPRRPFGTSARVAHFSPQSRGERRPMAARSSARLAYAFDGGSHGCPEIRCELDEPVERAKQVRRPR